MMNRIEIKTRTLQLIFTIALGALALVGSTQNPFNYCEKYTAELGLPSNRVNCIVEDNDGFWWIGTSTGLARYDGAYFDVYKHSEGQPGLIDNRIYDLLCVGDDLWIATHYGLSRLDLVRGNFENYGWTTDCVRAEGYSESDEATYELFLGADSSIWIGTHHCGYVRYIPEADSFVVNKVDTSLLSVFGTGTFATTNKISTWYVRAFLNDNTNDSILWVGTGAGLVRHNIISGESECLVRLHEEAGRENHAYGYYSLYQFEDGTLSLGVEDNALIIFDPITRTYGKLKPQLREASAILGSNPLNYHNWGDSVLWITTWHGVTTYDLRRKKFKSAYFNDSDNKHYVGANFVDSEGRVVRGTIWGMYVYDPVQQQFESSSLKHLNEGYHGYVYSVTHDTATNRYYACVRSARGLYYMDLNDKEWHRVDFPEQLELNDHISLTNMSRLSSGEYLITTTNNVVRYNPETHLVTGPEVNLDLTVNKLQDVFVDSRDIAWISSREDGVFRYNTRTGQVVNYRFPQQTLTVAAVDTETFIEDSKGRIWMKRRRGYSIYFPDNDSIAHYYPEGLHGSYGGTFAEDDHGNMWIASLPGWLGRIQMDSVENGVVDRVAIPGASKGNTLRDMVKGPDGYFWCAMKENLVKMDITNNEYQTYSYNYGVDPNEFFSFQFMEDNRMVFGKRSEVVIADPRTLHHNTDLPEPYISDLYLGPTPYQEDTVPARLTSLNFKPDENNFSIGFSTLGMSFGSENTTWYRLLPMQEDWIEARNSRVVNFTNVPFGDYTFELKAANNEGIVNEEVFAIPVRVATPWHATLLARMAFVVTAFLLMYLFYRNRVNQVRKEERLRTEFERQLAEVQMTALRAQMNPHFIFNCLNSIESFIIKNDTFRASTYLNDFARLIRLILQNSRSSLVCLEDEMEALGLYMQMENLRFTNRFEYEISVDSEVDLSNIEVPPMLIQPYVENAIWHGLMHKDTPGKLLVELSRENGSLKCIIEDDGVGRQRSQEIASGKRLKKGKSMGMSITQDRISALNNLYKTDTQVRIKDLSDSQGNPVGTRVELRINI